MGNNKQELSFNEFSRINRERCEKDIRPIKDWTSLEWSACLAGEVGEAANLIKKIKRGSRKLNNKTRKELAHEICDIISYVDLMAASLDIELEPSIREKFNIVSKKWGSKYRL